MLWVLLAAAAIATGALGELLSPALFGYGAGVNEVIVFQILLIGLILLGFYIILGQIPPGRESMQTPSIPTPEGVSADAPGVSVEAFQAHLGRNSMGRTFGQTVNVLMVALTALFVLLWLTNEYVSYSLLPWFSGFTLYYAVNLFVRASLGAGTFLGGATACLRAGKDSHNRIVVTVSSVTLILTAVLWVVAERTAYVMLLERIGYLGLSDYVLFAGLSGMALLLNVCIASVVLGLAMYFGRPRSPGTVKPTREPV